MQQLNRIQPVGPPEAYQTYAIRQPITTHWRPATCAEVDCEHFLNGWRTVIDEHTELGQKQAYYIRHDRSRRHRESRDDTGQLTVFTFEAGQTCFEPHRAPVGRPALYRVHRGDWRRHEPLRTHTNGIFWTEDLAEHLDKVSTEREKG